MINSYPLRSPSELLAALRFAEEYPRAQVLADGLTLSIDELRDSPNPILQEVTPVFRKHKSISLLLQNNY
jgi:hypothetical protein